MEITIENKSGAPFYVYGFNFGAPSSVQPVGRGNPLENEDQLNFQLQSNPKMRIYFSANKLTQSIEKGSAPDPFNFYVDGSIMYSFIEYNYESQDSRYTIDLSYIDEYSYPITLKFANVGSYEGCVEGCVEGFEYGFKSLQNVITELNKQNNYTWSALAWPLTNVKTRWDQYPNDIHRIVGPNKIWAAETNEKYKIGPWVPTSYLAFINDLPETGTQLFGSNTTNWNGWETFNATHSPSPSTTGYVQALHKTAISSFDNLKLTH
ncbi:MAG: hypothetical protein GY710_02380 [Desulfobacteraceae bacterium]|nr:hypothetical protein [Desulfobacteraceae bacterium]